MPEPHAILLAVFRAAKLIVPEEPEWTDIFPAIQAAAAHTFLDKILP